MSADVPNETGGLLAPLLRQLPALPDGWRYERLDQLVDARGICYGIVQPGQSVSSGVPMLRVNNVRGRTILRDDVMRVDPSIDSKHRRSRLRGGEVLLTIVGANFGEAAVAPIEVAGWNVARAIAVIPVTSKHDPQWVCFTLQSPSVRHFMYSWATTTAQPTLNLSDVAQLPIPIPPRDEMAAIAGLLRRLDNKIELIRQMNRTLEELTAVLFRAWFVDFEPVVAKAAGRAPFGIAPALAALFPATFADSELGPIPLGWRVAAVNEEVRLTKGVSYRTSELAESEVALVTLKSIRRGGGYRLDGLKPFTGRFVAEQIVKPGELIVSQTDVTQAAELVGRAALVIPDDRFKTLVASLDILIVRPINEELGCAFFYALFGTPDYISHVVGHANGTTVLHLDKQAVATFRFARPPRELALAFQRIAEPWLAQIAHNIREFHILSALRDTLLPKLLSGELRVKQAEPVLERA